MVTRLYKHESSNNTWYIDRRILVNFTVDHASVRKIIPEPFRPKVYKGRAIAGIPYKNLLMKHMIKLIIFALYFMFVVNNGYAFDRRVLPDTSIRFYSLIDKAQFDTLRGSVFTWEIFEPINDTISDTPFHERDSFVQGLTTGQKALFYIWELERAVLGGDLGFANYYYNYEVYFLETINGVKLINDTAMLEVLYGVNKIYLSHKNEIARRYKIGDWKYIQRKFASFDRAYTNQHEHTMLLLENYIRTHSTDFVRFK